MSETKITIPSYEEACKLTNRKPEDMPIVAHMPEREAKHHIADHKLAVIIEGTNKLINPIWKADFGDWNQEKWYPWPIQVKDESQPSGFGLSLYDAGDTYARTHAGARFAYCNEDAARSGFEANKQLYIDKDLNY